MDHFFDSFLTTRWRSAGLALSICRKIIGAREARLSLLPYLRGGSAFRIALPTEEAVS